MVHVYRTTEGKQICLLPLSRDQSILRVTQKMRVMPNVLFVALRKAIRERGANPEETTVVTIYPDGQYETFGILLLSSGQLVQFLISIYEDDSIKMKMWEPCVAGSAKYERWKEAIDLSKMFLEKQ